jgi:uncharacterized protein YciI
MKLHTCIFLAAASLAGLLTGCASTANYSFVYLKTGPESSRKTKEQSSTIFAGHMSNMKRLADEKKLIIAGPFEKPADSTWRGIFIFDTSTAAAAELVKTDPGFQSGVFVGEIHPFASEAGLKRTIQLEKELNAHAEPVKPGEPPKNIRPYVMITAREPFKARKVFAAGEPVSQALVFSGTFSDAQTAVFVLDALTVQEVKELLAANHADPGECSMDIWWSSKSLMGLKKPRS